jgi:hypothetical protein
LYKKLQLKFKLDQRKRVKLSVRMKRSLQHFTKQAMHLQQG